MAPFQTDNLAYTIISAASLKKSYSVASLAGTPPLLQFTYYLEIGHDDGHGIGISLLFLVFFKTRLNFTLEAASSEDYSSLASIENPEISWSHSY
jgi:hypothetical protein